MFKILKLLTKKEWGLFALSVAFIVLQVWLDLKLPDYMQKITILVETPNSSMAEIWKNGLYMVLCALSSLGTAIVVCLIASKVSATLSYNIRSKLYNKVQSFSMLEINKFSTASLITRSTNDVVQVQNYMFIALQVLIKAPIMAVWAICKVVDKGWQWSLATAIAIVALVVVISVLMMFVIPRFKIVQKLTDNINRVTRENLTGVRVVRAFNAENYQESKFEDANQALTKTQLFINKTMSVLFPAIGLILDCLTLSVFVIGAFLIYNANAFDRVELFADMIVFMSYAMQVVMAFMMLIIVFVLLPRATVSAKRINEVLDTESSIKDGNADIKDSNGSGEISFENVAFKYPNAEEYVLKDISFTVKKGETVAFIGSTGSGKSTLVNLLARFYDVTDGEIKIDGLNIKDYKQTDLYNKIGYISQKAILFSGDIKSNIEFGENGKESLTEDEIKSALEVAQANDFVNSLEAGILAQVAQGGTNFSGGQKQRLSIARAIARKPEILIFDDSFSALDYKTDKALRAKLDKMESGVTKIIVAQRIGTIMEADKIIVLDNGVIVGEGTHEQLLSSCEVYKEIALSQLSKEELENAKEN